MKSKKLIIDTAAFFRNVPLWEYSEEFFTVKEVMDEIKDKATKLLINALPIELKFRAPSAQSIKFINEFTRKTGDFASLSLTDVKILALAYEIEVESKKTSEHLRKEPLKCRTTVITSKPNRNSMSTHNLDGWYNPTNLQLVPETKDLSNDNISNYENFEVEFNDDDFDSEQRNSPCKEYENYHLTYADLFAINNHLREFSYVNGHSVSYEDFLILESWIEQCSNLRTIAETARKLTEDGQFDIMQDRYRQLVNSYTTISNTSSSHGASKSNDFDSLKTENECLTYQTMAAFVPKCFVAFPNLLRWAFHILSMGFNVTYLPSEGTSLRSTIFNIRKDVELTEECAPGNSQNEDLLHEILQEELIIGENEILDELPEIDTNDEDTYDVVQVRKQSTSTDSDEGFQNSSEEDSDIDEDDDDKTDDDDDDEGWITPSTLKKKKEEFESSQYDNNPLEAVEVACITADFAMQNTLKHIGLNVLGVDGKLVKSVRTFILRCYACFKTTDKMDSIFCKQCGNKTLKRVSVTLNPDGTQKIWISSRRPINIRGTKFTLPAPKGGKHAINPILVSDQREAQQRATKLSRIRNNPMHEDYGANNPSPFIKRDVYSRSFDLGYTGIKANHRGLFYWEKKNPNEPCTKSKSRRKKRH